MKLLAKEFSKLWHLKATKGVVAAFLCLAVLGGLVFGARPGSSPVEIYGFGAPFCWPFENGICIFILYAVLVGNGISREFERGIVRDVLDSGMGKGQYFAAKVLVLFLTSILIYLVCGGIFFVLRSIRMGFAPEGVLPYEYGRKVLVYITGALILILTYVAVFIFVASLFRETAWSILISALLPVAEIILKVKAPFMAALDTIAFVQADNLLSWEFARLFLPYAGILVAFLVAAYVAFVVQKAV